MKAKLIIDVQHGLANRLRAYACASVIAKFSNRDLQLVWTPDHHCECHFHDLFTNPVELVSHLPVEQEVAYYNYMDDDSPNQYNSVIDDTTDLDLCIRSGHWLHNRHVNWERVVCELKRLNPLKRIADLVNSIDVSSSVGVAVRLQRGKSYRHLPWEANDNWSFNGQVEIDKWADLTRLESFYNRMDSILSEDEETHFFLTADLPETYDAMRTRFGEKILCTKQIDFNRSKASIQHALADMLLLSKTKMILGSPYSSYSILAAKFFDIRLEVVGVDF